MIRTTLLFLFVAYFSVYAWKNWFISLCAAILLMAVIQHPDFPNSIGGVQGANPWNVLILSVVMAWAARRSDDGYRWDLPRGIGAMLFGTFLVIIVGVLRLLSENRSPDLTLGTVISEQLINTIKWIVPSILLFDACRTRRRVAIAIGVILCLYFLLAVQVIRWMPIGSLGGGDDLASRASKTIQNEVGYNRVTLSMMLAGASWAAMATIPILRKNSHRIMLFTAGGIIAFGQALTGGRTGYVTWIAVGLLLATLRWRKLLLLIPVVLIIIGVTLPSVRDRMFQGFGGQEGNFTSETSAYEMTSGRDIAWPLVIEQIGKSPMFGYGREGMITSGLFDYLLNVYGESFPHPHQAYLQILLDNGFVGFFMFMPFFFYVAWISIPALLNRNDPLICAVGCVTFCLLFSLLIGAFGGQTFYPREGAAGLWAAMGLMLRIHVNLRRARETGDPIFPDSLPASWFVDNTDSLEYSESV